MTLAISNIPGVFHAKALPFSKRPPSPRKTRPPQSAHAPSPRRAPLADFERKRLREKIAAVTCSVPWSDHASAQAEQQGFHPNLGQVIRQLADRGIYPPKPDLGPGQLPRRRPVRMRRCDACGRIVPPHNMACHKLVRLCDDCRFEPPLDLDETTPKQGIARTPGVHQCTLLRGCVNDDNANRTMARTKLRSFGLSDAEIMAFSFSHAGYSTRRIAEFGRWSQTYALKLIRSAAAKLRRSGIALPTSSASLLTCRSRLLDPDFLDASTDRVR